MPSTPGRAATSAWRWWRRRCLKPNSRDSPGPACAECASTSCATYHHGVTMAHALWRAHGDRCVWGSDWPHPSQTHIPDAAALVAALAQIAPSETERQRLLVDNPQRLYRFA
ncbi:MAG: amidohydrolase family protein [bacterium]